MLKQQSQLLEAIILLEKFKKKFCHLNQFSKPLFLLLFINLSLIFLSQSLRARESVTLDFDESVHVLSDKAFRKTRENLFEAVGNVILTKKDDSLYGEKASVSMITGDAFVEGNARYIGDNLTAYGSKISYNFKSTLLDIENARVISDNYVILGKKISRISKDVITAENAEYTTCKDCPESWSILGKKVEITLGEYIRISHAYIKIRGVVVLYIPYIILPIKKKRETGILFPSLALDIDEGISFSQPWFYNISPSRDLTFTPIFLGKRGTGAHTEYRHVFGEKRWLDINSFNTWDRIYKTNTKDSNEEDKGIVLSGTTDYRSYHDIESYWSWNNSFRHYLNLSWPEDLDMIRDYYDRLSQTPYGTETGLEAFMSFKSSVFSFNLESFYNRNLLYNDSLGFDHRYVQILPRFSYSLLPLNIFHSELPLLRGLNFYASGDYTIFKQNHILENEMIRNAHRINSKFSLEWDFGRIGPLSINSIVRFDHQNYHFPHEENQRSFYKYGLIYQTEAKLELSKIYGVAHREKIRASDLILSPKKNEEKQNKNLKKTKTKDEKKAYFLGNLSLFEKKEKRKDEIIGELPMIDDLLREDEFVEVKSTSHRHLQTFNFRHIYLTDEFTSGSDKFYNQILDSSGDGQFDSRDALLDRKNELSEISSKVELPVNNTIEFSWNNSLIRKSARTFNIIEDGHSVRDNFDFSRVSYFNVSQGIDLYTQRKKAETQTLQDKLTRLLVTTGINNDIFNLSFSEYYFYDTKKHIFNLNFNQSFDYFKYNTVFVYDSFSRNRSLVVDSTLDVLPRVSLKLKYDYNILNSELNYSRYSLMYTPSNKCWKIDVHYTTDKIRKKFSFNFYINFNDNSFTGLSGV